MKTQLGDQEGLGGKIDDDDKKKILDAVKETTEWIDDHGSTASVEELEEKLSGSSLWVYLGIVCVGADSCYTCAEVQSVVNPITSKLYAGGDYTPGEDDDQDPIRSHDEL